MTSVEKIQSEYEKDFYGWAMANAKALSEQRFNEVDYEHIIEELEDMGKNTYYQLENRLSVLIAHLLKWQYQPTHRPWDVSGKSWHLTIKEQRKRITDLLEDNPSLKSRINKAITRGYKYAFAIIEKETPIDLETLPDACPYSFEQIIDREFFPDNKGG